MMTFIDISDVANDMLIGMAERPFRQTGFKIETGWRIPVEEETAARMRERMFAGETFSDLIIRLATGGQGRLS